MAESKQRDSVYKKITNKILEALHQETVPWVRPWQSEGLALPYSGATKKPYQSVNLLLLAHAEMVGGYKNSDWYTFNKAKELGGQVRKDEKSSFIVYFNRSPKFDGKFITKKKEDELIKGGNKSSIEYIPVMTMSFVFNRDQIDGLPEKNTAELDAIRARKELIDSSDMVQKVKRLMSDNQVARKSGGDKATYSAEGDFVQMPHSQNFNGPEQYASTFLHLMGHWTGHESRLNRDLSGQFGDQTYAFEEMVAEIASGYLCANLGIDGFLQHPEYIKSWIQVLNDDEKAFYKAARMAQEASEYLLSPDQRLNAAHSGEQDNADNEVEEESSMSM